MQKKYDKIYLGITFGLLLPLVVFAIIMYGKYTNSFQLQYLGIKYIINFAPKFLSLSLCANLLPFYVFLQTNRMRGVQGILIATFTLALFVFILFIIR